LKKKALIIDGFCKQNGNRTTYNKKGSPENPRLRVVLLPDPTLLKLTEFLKNKTLGPDDFIFTYEGKPIRAEFAEDIFYRALKNCGIIPPPEPVKRNKRGEGRKKISKIKPKPPDGRKLVPHSLRYTYVSRMRRELSAAELRPMTGHTTVEMVDYYTRTVLDEALASLPQADSALENLLSWEK
jgi:integrase